MDTLVCGSQDAGTGTSRAPARRSPDQRFMKRRLAYFLTLGTSVLPCAVAALAGCFGLAADDGTGAVDAALPDANDSSLTGDTTADAGAVAVPLPDAASTGAGDASAPGATNDAVAGDSSAVDATDTEAPDASDRDAGDASNGPPTSCLDVLRASPGSASGIYSIVVDGTTIQAHCDMTLFGGGWTAFFSGPLGAANVFARFDALDDGGVVDSCSVPDTRCLRHIPSTVTLANALAATCGDAAVLLTVAAPGLVLDYFRTGTPYNWLAFASVGAGGSNTNAANAAWIWTGASGGGNPGWILSAAQNAVSPSNATFASSYDAKAAGWDYCNGVSYNGAAPSTMPMEHLFYR